MKTMILTLFAIILMTACNADNLSTDYAQNVNLRIDNQSNEVVYVKVFTTAGVLESDGSAPITIPASGSSEVFQFTVESGSSADTQPGSLYLRVSGISVLFYASNIANTPFDRYDFPYVSCQSSSDLEAWRNGSIPDTDFLYGGELGVTNTSLFSPSSERPFYLKRDEADPLLGRIVITQRN
ncbi:MAG: hypothetical protein JW875_08345 [Spirochaetales bacterium]|nr:hypothetical protein [Spirochaetales bacterium]